MIKHDKIRSMGNAVGSLRIPNLLRARKNLLLALTGRQKDILIGCVLGDAHIRPLGQIRIEHSVKQKEYVLWKHQELKSLSYPALPREIIRKDLARNRVYSSVFFTLRQYFRPWRFIFYHGRNKIFPNSIKLTPLSLAVWYMDDGCWTGKKCVISTDGFDVESRMQIQNTLYNQFGLETVIGRNRKLVIRKKSHDKFYGLISPYIIPSMKYKIPSPVTTSLN